jgi:DNA anti-recombination protein RmuC
MAKVKFDLGSIVKNVHHAIDPEASVPPDQEKNPMGYRASRLAEIVKGLKEKHEGIADEFAKMETHLEEVVEHLKEVAKAHEEEAKKDEADGGDKKEEAAEDKKEEAAEEKKEDAAEEKKE